jgi:hydroxyacid-oxoacid transhydrogenase
MAHECLFTMDASSIKFGVGATKEVGFEARRLGMKKVMVLTDAGLTGSDAVKATLDSLRTDGVDYFLYDRVRVEPTDGSLQEAIDCAMGDDFDGFVAVGGGSSIDTAKAANLYSTYPADFLAYVNPPVGEGRPIPGALKPLIAVPTTAGTGSETTGVSIFDLVKMHAKTGIAHRALRPTIGVVDPNNTKSLPKMVAACSGLDVLSHALESMTALPYNQREAAEDPAYRPAYQGSNPISDLWASKALEMVAANIVQAADKPDDDDARSQMMLAATYAGIGFGNAGVHLPHGMSYPVSGNVRSFKPDGYDVDHPIIPHGMSVILNAPSVFRWTAAANPGRHLQAAQIMGVDISDATPMDAGEVLSGAVIEIMKALGIPNGLTAVGYSEDDIPTLVEGTLPQHRVTKLAPRPAGEAELAELFKGAMRYW